MMSWRTKLRWAIVALILGVELGLLINPWAFYALMDWITGDGWDVR